MSEKIDPLIYCQTRPEVPPEYQTAQYQQEEIIASLSSKERYIKVFAFSYKAAIKKQNRKPPKIVVYQQTEGLTISDLVSKYVALTNQPDEGDDIDFVLKSGFALDKQKTIKQIKKLLRVHNLDGLEIYMKSLSDTFYRNECALQTIIHSSSSFKNETIYVPFALPGTNYQILVPIAQKAVHKNKELFEEVLTHLTTEIQRVFAKNIDKQNIQLVFKIEEKQIWNQHIYFGKLCRDDKVQVLFKDQNKLPDLPCYNNSFLFISGYGISSNKLHYDDIKEKRLIDVLNQIQARPNWNEFGLIINKFVIKPLQKICKAQAYMKNPTNVSRYFACKIIPEVLIFLAEQQRIRKANSFDIEKILDENWSNLELLKTCKSKIQDRAQSTSHAYFKGNLKNVEPILLYTSQINVKQSSNKKYSSLYRCLNFFLREQQFCLTVEEDYKSKWEYTFTSELLEKLKMIEPLQKQVVLWRGVGYIPSCNVGDRILFKQFTSTLIDVKLVKKLHAHETIFKITKSYSGKPIGDFSFFKDQNEVIFQPYIQFEVKNVSQFENEEKNKKKTTLLEIEEILRPPMPNSNALYLLWVDDNTKEGLKIWNNLTDIKDTSVMIPLLTTEQLKFWMRNNQALLKDDTVQFLLVTNMARMEKGCKKDEAGIEAIKEYRTIKPNGHIFVYIGCVEVTLQKLKRHHIEPNDKLQVSNASQSLKKFLNEVGGLK